MKKILTIFSKLNSVKESLKRLEFIKQKYSLKEIKEDFIVRSAFERIMYSLSDQMISTAEVLISLESLKKGEGYRDSLLKVLEYLHFPESLMNDCAKIAGFRNILAHEYEELDYDLMYNILMNHLSDISYFIEKVEQYIETKSFKN